MAETVHTLQAALDDWAEVAPALEHEAMLLSHRAREDAGERDSQRDGRAGTDVQEADAEAENGNQYGRVEGRTEIYQ